MIISNFLIKSWGGINKFLSFSKAVIVCWALSWAVISNDGRLDTKKITDEAFRQIYRFSSVSLCVSVGPGWRKKLTCTHFLGCYLSEFLRRSLINFIIEGFWTIVFISIVIFTPFQPICPPAFFRGLNFLDEVWWFLSFRVFGLWTSYCLHLYYYDHNVLADLSSGLRSSV